MTVGAFIATGIYCATALAGAWHITRRIVRALRPRVAPEHQAPRADLPAAKTVRP